MIKNLAIIVFFYILVLLQTSFLIHFGITGKLVAYILILIPLLLISFLIPQQQWSMNASHSPSCLAPLALTWEDVVAAFSAGFFLDIFSGSFIGFHILILICLVFFIKFILKKHIVIPKLICKKS